MKSKLILVSACFFTKAVYSQTIPIQLFFDAGVVYGIKTSNLENSVFDLHHKPSLQSSIGVRVSDYKQKHNFQLQVGYTSANYSISKDGRNIPLTSKSTNNNLKGPINSTSHMLAIKAAYAHSFISFKYKEKNIKFLLGVGACYVANYDGQEYNFENRKFTIDEYALGISLDRKMEQTATGNQRKEINRQPNLQAMLAAQFSKVNKPIALELYWTPSITPAIKSTYLLTRNFSIIGQGDANQMQNAIGLKMLYQLKSSKRKKKK
jgi:hypothetical protein